MANVPANVIQDRKVIVDRIKDILETGLETTQLMTIDNDLVQGAGMVKEINTYEYQGAVEAVAEGAANTQRGKVVFTSKDYRVQVKQQVFDYTDEQYMKDPMVVEVGAKGMVTTMKNDMNNDFFTEIAKTTTLHTDTVFNYDTIVDAIEKMNVVEDEQGLFLLLGNDLKADIRKDADFKSSRLGEMLYSGQFGSISGVPVIYSKKVPANTAYLATREAVTLFMKKSSELESDRDKEHRINTEIGRKVCLVALTDATKAVKITIAPARTVSKSK
ncbi:MAG: hypothetical protein ACRCX8_13845 [Sarcina sp.]